MLFISKKDFRNLVEGLMSEMTLYGPVKNHGHPAYAEISSFDELVPGMPPTHLSAKEFLFPPKETLLDFDIEKKEVSSVVQSKRQEIIGLPSCHISAVRSTVAHPRYGSSAPAATPVTCDGEYVRARGEGAIEWLLNSAPEVSSGN